MDENLAFENPISCGSHIYNKVTDFYVREAWLLDHHRLKQWSMLLAPDVQYTMPLRVTEPKAAETEQISRDNWHYNEDYESLCARIQRIVGTKSAWSDDPGIRIRRFITNLVVGKSDNSDELNVMSYVFVVRSRFESEKYHFVTAERSDRLRPVGDSYQIVAREVVIDISVLGIPNLGFFI